MEDKPKGTPVTINIIPAVVRPKSEIVDEDDDGEEDDAEKQGHG